MRRLGYIVGGILYIVILGEVFVRILAPEPLMPRFVTGGDHGIRANLPSVSYSHETKDATTAYRINGAGFRADREYAVEKPDGVCRVLMFGDSFMFGYEVNVEHSVPYLVERFLTDAGLNCEVINFGVSGFGTAEMLVLLENVGIDYSPDAVVFQWHRTDFDDNVRSSLYRLTAGVLERNADNYLPAVGIRDALMNVPGYPFVIQHSQLYTALRETVAGRAKTMLADLRRSSQEKVDNSARRASNEPASPAQPPYEVQLSASLLHEARLLANAHGAKFYLLDMPANSRGEATSTLDRFPPGLLAELEVIELENDLNRSIAAGTPVYYEYGAGHFNPVGYSIAAASISDTLLLELD